MLSKSVASQPPPDQEKEAVALFADIFVRKLLLPILGTLAGIMHSPRHQVEFNSRNEGLKVSPMTWQA